MTERPIIFSKPMVLAILAGNEARRIRIDDDWLCARFSEGATASEMAAQLGCSTHPVKKAMHRLGLRRPAKPRAGKTAGPNNPAWRGGRRVRRDGYVLVWTPNGERLEHRVVAEAMLGRSLLDSEIVHHRDGNRQNNDYGNLEVMGSQSEHAHRHGPDLSKTLKNRRGDRNPNAKLTAGDVLVIRASKDSSRKLAHDFGVHASTIQNIQNGKTWTGQ